MSDDEDDGLKPLFRGLSKWQRHNHKDPGQVSSAGEYSAPPPQPPESPSPGHGWQPLRGLFVGRGTQQSELGEQCNARPGLGRKIQSTGVLDVVSRPALPCRWQPITSAIDPAPCGQHHPLPTADEEKVDKAEKMAQFVRCMNKQQATIKKGRPSNRTIPDMITIGMANTSERKSACSCSTTLNSDGASTARNGVNSSDGSVAAGGSGSRQDFRKTLPKNAPSNQNPEFTLMRNSNAGTTAAGTTQNVLFQKLRALEDRGGGEGALQRTVSPPLPVTAATAPAEDILEEHIELKLKLANHQSTIDAWEEKIRHLERENHSLREQNVQPQHKQLEDLLERIKELTNENFHFAREVTALTEENDHLKRQNRGQRAELLRAQGRNATLPQENAALEMELLRDTNKSLRAENLRLRRELELMKNSMTKGAQQAGIQKATSVSSILASRRLKSRGRLGSSIDSKTKIPLTRGNEEFAVDSRQPLAKSIPRTTSFGWY